MKLPTSTQIKNILQTINNHNVKEIQISQNEVRITFFQEQKQEDIKPQVKVSQPSINQLDQLYLLQEELNA